MGNPGGLVALLPLLILMVPIAISVWWKAPKMGANRPLWVVLMLIPVVNFFAIYVFFFVILGAIFDKLNSIQATMDQGNTST